MAANRGREEAECTGMDYGVILIERFDNIKEQTVKLDDTLIIGFCLKGRGVVSLNNIRYNILPNEMIICPPNVIIESCLVSLDFEGRLFAISSRVSEMISVISAVDTWNIFQLINKKPIWSLSPETIKTFLLYYDLFKIHLSEEDHDSYRQRKMYSLLQAFAYDLYRAMRQFIYGARSERQGGGKETFLKFLQLLSTIYPCNRKVSFYADSLNVSPKYLSFICKQQCGKTASEIINQRVVKEIQTLLRDTRKSIKEICNDLDFPNMSFFGTYVRHHLNMSPKEYRNVLLQEKGEQEDDKAIDF